MTRFVVLAPPSDETALRVGALLSRRHGPGAVEVRTPEELLLAVWDHRLSSEGVSARITLHDGVRLPDFGQAVVLNRLVTVEPLQFAGAPAADQDYARMESFALVVSWLHGFGPRAVNPPTPSSLCGGFYRPLVWQALAARAGFATLELSAASSTRCFPPLPDRVTRDDVDALRDPHAHLSINTFQWRSRPPPERRRAAFVLGDRVLGDIPQVTAQACVRLARLAGVSLLKVELDDQGAFVGADACPALPAGEPVAALATFLESRLEAA